MKLTQSSVEQLISQSKLLGIRISTLITIKEQTGAETYQKQEGADTAQHARSQQSKGSATQTDYTNPRITNMRGSLRSRSPNRGKTLTLKPRPLTTHSGRNQPMLSNSNEINTSGKSKIPMSEPTTNVMILQTQMSGLGGWTRMSCPPSPEML